MCPSLRPFVILCVLPPVLRGQPPVHSYSHPRVRACWRAGRRAHVCVRACVRAFMRMCARERLGSGSVIVFDEYHKYQGFFMDEFLAWKRVRVRARTHGHMMHAHTYAQSVVCSSTHSLARMTSRGCCGNMSGTTTRGLQFASHTRRGTFSSRRPTAGRMCAASCE